MAKKKAAAKAAPAVEAAPAGMPPQQMMPPAGMPGMPQPGMMPGQNPMMAMFQMMQMMAGGGGGMMPSMVDPSAMPFTTGVLQDDPDRGLDADIIRPATLDQLIKKQEALPTGSVLDYLCLSEDGKKALGGVPKGCTIAMAGPPGKGKTRTALAALCRVAATGMKVAFVVAEEGFHDEEGSGRDDLCSRLVKIGMAVTGLDEKKFVKQVLDNVFVMESQYHKGQTWDDFVTKYRYLVEREDIGFVVIDSLNMLDPSRNRTADNLSSLKTYNHEQGVTCVCIGQIKDTGDPVGGEALQHTADVVFLIEEMGLSSKEIAEQWGGQYRDRIDVIRVVKSVTTPTFPQPVRIARAPITGELIPHEKHPDAIGLPKLK
ncbi:MAG: RAD55 family ATPase [Planctomycetota bacterium]